MLVPDGPVSRTEMWDSLLCHLARRQMIEYIQPLASFERGQWVPGTKDCGRHSSNRKPLADAKGISPLEVRSRNGSAL
jgi:hypothetical protein